MKSITHREWLKEPYTIDEVRMYVRTYVYNHSGSLWKSIFLVCGGQGSEQNQSSIENDLKNLTPVEVRRWWVQQVNTKWNQSPIENDPRALHWPCNYNIIHSPVARFIIKLIAIYHLLIGVHFLHPTQGHICAVTQYIMIPIKPWIYLASMCQSYVLAL